MNKHLIAGAAGLTALMLSATSGLAAQAASTEDFVKTVAISDMFEIQSGQLAADKAESNNVKLFAKMMVDDHTKTSSELKGLVVDQNIKAELPTALDADHKSKLDQLSDLSGNQFDKQYIREQVDAHQKAVSLFEGYAASGDNGALKAWAEKTLPTLKSHLEQAQQLKPGDQTAAADAPPADTAAKRDDAGPAPHRGSRAEADDESGKKTAQATRKSNIKYVTRQAPNDWTAEALIGRTVENSQGDNLGEINNVIINEKGSVVAVVVGVGGFLGIGEKNVGVPFDDLTFRVSDPAEIGTRDRDQKADEKRDALAARFDSEHDDMHIVLDTTKEDLEAAPTFAWLDDQTATDAQQGGGDRGERVVQ